MDLMYSSMSFNICIGSYNHNQNQHSGEIYYTNTLPQAPAM